MTKFFRDADSFRFVNDKAVDIYDELPAGNYLIKQNAQTGELYLEMVDGFTSPPKLYGDTEKTSQRILSTFYSRPAGTGVLLVGEKGSGKTLLARTCCINAAKDFGIPTIIINAPWKGDNFFAFISSIHQPCIILFDEFEKVYEQRKNGEDQNAILTLLDGVFPTKKLFLMTCNDRHAINQNMINRPGRIFYSLEFHGLEENFIREYCQDNLAKPEHIDAIVRATSVFSEFNFDMLKALIEEMNRYDETPAEALRLLNVSPEYDFANYGVMITLGCGITIEQEHTSPSSIRNPLGQKGGIHATVYVKSTKENYERLTAAGYDTDSDDFDLDGDDVKADSTLYRSNHKNNSISDVAITFFPSELVSADREKMVLRNSRGDTMTLTKEKFGNYNWNAL